jgi:hypothetical protein
MISYRSPIDSAILSVFTGCEKRPSKSEHVAYDSLDFTYHRPMR